MTRVYVPATLALLGEWHAAGAVPASAERVPAAGEDEESEYAALMTAAAASAAITPAGGRRVVVVAEATPGDVPIGEVVAVHCDTDDRPADADPDDDLAWFATQEIPALI
jgi:hypothetical protein